MLIVYKEQYVYSYVHTMIGLLLPPSSPTPPFLLTPSFLPPPPHFQADTVLPLSLIYTIYFCMGNTIFGTVLGNRCRKAHY
jgi:hypothetical protein